MTQSRVALSEICCAVALAARKLTLKQQDVVRALLRLRACDRFHALAEPCCLSG